jgi:hypothetical protein
MSERRHERDERQQHDAREHLTRIGPNYSAFKGGIIRSNPLAFPRASGKNIEHVVEFACRNVKGQGEILRGYAGWRGLRSVGYRSANAALILRQTQPIRLPLQEAQTQPTRLPLQGRGNNAAFNGRRIPQNLGQAKPLSKVVREASRQ